MASTTKELVVDFPKILELKHVEFDEKSLHCISPLAHTHETSSQISAGSDDSPKRRRPRRTRRERNKSVDSPLVKENNSKSRNTPDSKDEDERKRDARQRNKETPKRQRHESGKSTTTTTSASDIKSIETKKTSHPVQDDSDSDTTSTSTTSSEASSNPNTKCRGLAGKSNAYISAHRAVNTGKKFCGCVLRDRVYYMVKPMILIFFGTVLIGCGIALTVFHFLYEDSLGRRSTTLPYFTYGPITLSGGVITFMIGLVWFPIKQQKWKDGTASPIIAALARMRLARGDIELGGIAMTFGRDVSKEEVV